jgi:DNA-binding CsgD family transcriptional regulator/2-polyprenyl-3-methyl-5-hydroxy-6-metoxy-1,4-benzoquinol methylase
MMEKLAERDEEEKVLAKVYSECAVGRSRLVAISGPLASGKTALLRSFAHDAADAGAIVLEATASSFERQHPLGIIDQLLRGRQLSSPRAEREVRSLLEGVRDPVACVDESGTLRQISLPILNLLHGAFQYLASSQPLFVCIDDAHFTDIESLHYLLALMRRMSNASISFIFGYCEDMGRDSVRRIFQAEILRMPDCCKMPLKPLSVTGVATILGEYFDLETAGRLAPECRHLSGGKPLLVHALAEDYLTASQVREPGTSPVAHERLVAGPAYGRAVLSCLYRSESIVLELSQVTAILRAGESPSVVARFCGMAPESVWQVVASAGLGGLLDCHFLGQPSVRTAVIGSIPPSVRLAMHSRAAHLLHDEGAPALAIAEHLMLIDEEIPWAHDALSEAADQALVNGNQEAAIGYLKKIYHACTDRREQASISAKLTDVMWHHKPCAAKRYLPDLVAAIEDGYLAVEQSVQVIMYLLWHGEVAQAANVFTLLRERPHSQVTDHTISYIDQLFLWLGTGRGDVVPANAIAPACTPEHRAPAALGAVLRGAGEASAVFAAEQVLREAGTGVASPASSIASLVVLIYSDQLDRASVWCDSLLAGLGEEHGIVWKAMFTSARAAVYYRLGDLANAERQAHEALALMSPESWGTALVVPLSFLVLASTAMGRFQDADSYVKVPVPDAAFETLGGLHYLGARGHLHLATGRYDAALQDFLTCGQLMKLWDVDCPAAVSWRTGAAQAYLGKGLVPQARELIADQLALLPPGQSRIHAITYRAHAATLSLEERRPVLLRAANIFERCGDSLGLAYALTDLSCAYQALGDRGRARVLAHKARALTERCSAAPLRASLAAIAEDEVSAERLSERRRPAPHLSEAELRVAELAASGSTNEQIAQALFITVSTVEQHLTHSYRKLAIRRRGELPSRLREAARLRLAARLHLAARLRRAEEDVMQGTTGKRRGRGTGATLDAFRFNAVVNHIIFAGRRNRVYQRLVLLSGVQPGNSALDVGSSIGYLTGRLAAAVGPSGHVTGVDPSERAIAYARRHARPGMTFTVGTAQDLDLPDSSFDAVTCTLAMHHIPARHRSAAFAQMYRVTQPGGRLLVADMRPMLRTLEDLATTAGYHVESVGKLALLGYVVAVRPRGL